MKVQRMRVFGLFVVFAAAVTISSCNKPTSGQNTSEYRDGGSGATSGTIIKDADGGKAETPEKNKDR